MRNARAFRPFRASLSARLAGTAAAAVLLALALGPPGARAAGLLIADGGFGGVLEIEDHDARVVINNGVAVTETIQVFRNTENRQVEALYVFPVPKGASVSDFSMWIGGKEMTGEVLEKKRAREIYESYKRTRRDPGLLEQVDYKTFELRIFPIGPNASQRVRVVYYQELDFDDDWATYVYPLATVAREGVDPRVRGRFSFSLQAKSAVPIVAMESPSHPDDFIVADYGDSYREASMEVSGGDLRRDLVIAYQAKRPRTGLDLAASRPGQADGHFCLTLTLGEELDALRQDMDFVFVLDISGSMANSGKLIVSREAVEAFLRSLAPEDRFEIITFNARPELLFQRLQPAEEAFLAQAGDFLDDQRARGGTSLRPAIEAAYRYGDPDRPLNVVVLSDGMAEQGERAELLRLIGERPANAKVFCVGVGNEVNRPLLRQMAEDAGGLAAFISRGDNFERQARSFRRKLTRPVGVNLSIDIDGVEVYDTEPRQLPNLYHGSPVRLYGRYRGCGQAKATIRAEVDGRSLRKSFDVDFPLSDDRNGAIDRMWAWKRVDRLLAEADRAGDRQPVIDEIVRLGEGYSIVTEYTSFLVLENDAEYRRWKIERRNALRSEADRGQRQRLLADLERIRDENLAGLGPVDRDAAPVQAVEQAAASRQPAQVASAPDGWEPNPRPEPPRSSPSRGWRGPRWGGGGGGGGGGALDPVSAGLAVVLAAMALGSARKRED